MANQPVEVGARIRAVVTEVLEGVIVLEHDGRIGAVPIVELTWDERIRARTDEVARAGDTLEVVVTAVSGDRFSASLRALNPAGDPWRDPPQVGERVRGTVRSVRDWGAFVELGDRPLVAFVEDGAGLTIGATVELEVTRVELDDRRLQTRLINEVGC